MVCGRIEKSAHMQPPKRKKGAKNYVWRAESTEAWASHLDSLAALGTPAFECFLASACISVAQASSL